MAYLQRAVMEVCASPQPYLARRCMGRSKVGPCGTVSISGPLLDESLHFLVDSDSPVGGEAGSTAVLRA